MEAVKAIRSRLPEIPIDYKLAVRQEDPHYGNAGVVESELGIFVPLLTDAGVTSFHVTLANHSSLEDTIPPANHPYFKEQGCFCLLYTSIATRLLVSKLSLPHRRQTLR